MKPEENKEKKPMEQISLKIPTKQLERLKDLCRTQR